MVRYATHGGDGPAPKVVQSLDELAREEARHMIAAVPHLAAAAYFEQLRGAWNTQGPALVDNGRARKRQETVGTGTIAIRSPWAHNREPGQRFTSKILRPTTAGCTRSPTCWISSQTAVGTSRCLAKDTEILLTFFDFPAEHWRHLRTTNPIESPFPGVRARTRPIKRAGSRKAGLAMALNLALGAEAHWRKLNAPHLVTLVRADARFHNGVHVVTPEAYKQQTDGSREGIAA